MEILDIFLLLTPNTKLSTFILYFKLSTLIKYFKKLEILEYVCVNFNQYLSM